MSRDDLILLMEADKRLGAQLVARTFGYLGAADRVFWVRDGAEAIRFIESGPRFAGFVIDHDLVDQGTLDVLARIDARYAPGMPILLRSSRYSEESARIFDRRGLYLVPKPKEVGVSHVMDEGTGAGPSMRSCFERTRTRSTVLSPNVSRAYSRVPRRWSASTRTPRASSATSRMPSASTPTA